MIKPCTFQYVSLSDTIQKLFQNETFKKIYFSHNNNSEEYLRNFNDGSNFQNSKFFQNNPNALQIQIFIDNFEVVNALGSKKSMHK